jgi:hypothetical protein
MAEQEVGTRRQAAVNLGGQEFVIEALPMGAARRWRAKFGQPLETILGVLQNAPHINLQDAQNLSSLIQQVGGLVLGSTDLLVDALFDYAPALAAEREWIEENADDSEALAALWEVLKLAYPFGDLLNMLGRGQATIGTKSNFAGRNGASNRKR